MVPHSPVWNRVTAGSSCLLGLVLSGCTAVISVLPHQIVTQLL